MKLWLLLFLIILSLGVFAVDTDINILSVGCSNDGKLKLTVKSTGTIIDSDSIEARAVFQGEEDVDAFYFPLKADARYITSEDEVVLESNEAVFNWSGIYQLRISYAKGDSRIKFPYDVGCPGLLFSCKLGKLEIRDCINKDDRFEAIVVVNNLEILEGVKQIENVNFFMETEEPYEDVNGEFSTIGGLAKDFEIINKSSDVYVIAGEFKDNNVKSLTAKFKYNECELIVEEECSGEESKVISDMSTTGATEITGEMTTELERKRQEVAEIVKRSVEAREEGLGVLKWIILIIISTVILGTGMYILVKRKANKKLKFVKF